MTFESEVLIVALLALAPRCMPNSQVSCNWRFYDAAASDLGMCRLDVRDYKGSHGRTSGRSRYSAAEGDRASRARRSKLDDANILCRGDILIEPPAQLLIELLGSLDIRQQEPECYKRIGPPLPSP